MKGIELAAAQDERETAGATSFIDEGDRRTLTEGGREGSSRTGGGDDERKPVWLFA